MKDIETRIREKVVARARVKDPSLEKSLERRFRRECERRGWICIKFESPGNTGVPDRIVIDHSGGVSFVELKKGRSARTMARQRYWNGRLRSMGVKAFFVRDAESMRECMVAISRAEAASGWPASGVADAKEENGWAFVKAVRYGREGKCAARHGRISAIEQDEEVAATIAMSRAQWSRLLGLIEERVENTDDYDEWADLGILSGELFKVTYGKEPKAQHEDR